MKTKRTEHLWSVDDCKTWWVRAASGVCISSAACMNIIEFITSQDEFIVRQSKNRRKFPSNEWCWWSGNSVTNIWICMRFIQCAATYNMQLLSSVCSAFAKKKWREKKRRTILHEKSNGTSRGIVCKRWSGGSSSIFSLTIMLTKTPRRCCRCRRIYVLDKQRPAEVKEKKQQQQQQQQLRQIDTFQLNWPDYLRLHTHTDVSLPLRSAIWR